ncbi:uncharacterized protein BDR25DRAFT_22865 [Lindgomyces ingoldianus]|uniref:Uncharacterized protein n=1 Tax=Lindgomyces ingoldianus TaxID=673940 RepID=A0ACB6R0C0_9PLEO|nr:uncharacterized protein BDR25DRAFT_22865 [Lindgomyces ingoldianus]KAF2471770.1 hypothetical protein BDR25DRAFT_22865 [Lindgomyces ingoldianus]
MISLQSIVLFLISYFVIPRLTFLPKSLHGLLTIFGPFLLPRLVNLFNTSRATSRSVPVRPVPTKVLRALNILFASAVVSLVLSVPYFAPENIFLKTQSRLQIQADVLFARLKLLRPLTEEDEVLRSKFSASGQYKLLYLTYGPDTLINCIWCTTSDGIDAQNYFLYSLPKMVTPHIFHLAVLGLATSSLVGSEGSRFRTHATIAGLLLMVAEIWFLNSYDVTLNKKAKVLQELDFVHWRVRVLRYLAFAASDGILACVLWATSTNRWLASPPAIAERLEVTTRQAEETLNKLRALGLLTNSINRDPALRGVREEYWQTEGTVMAETVQEEEVMDTINQAVNNLDLRSLEGRVGEVADGILAGIDGLRGSQTLSASDMQ